MKALLTAVGSAGDVHPVVGLGAALCRRGHQVTLITNDYFQPLAHRAGLEFASSGTVAEYNALWQNPDLWHWSRNWPAVIDGAVGPAMRPTYEAIAAGYVPGETVVAAGTMALGARIAHDKLGVPLATLHTSPSSLRSAYDPAVLHALYFPRVPAPLARLQSWLTDVLVADKAPAVHVNALRAELDLPPVRKLFGGWLQSPQRVIGLFPDWYAPPQRDWPPQTRLSGFPLYDQGDTTEPSDELQDFLASGTAPVVFTPGFSMSHGDRFFAEAVHACEMLGRRALLVTRFAEHIPVRLPDRALHVRYAPFSWLLPRTAAIVHHSGVGTASHALAAGIPQLLMPMGHDQFDHAARIERLGVGRQIRRSAFRGPKVARTLDDLLNSADVARRCREIAARFPGQTPLEDICDDLEELCGRTCEAPAR